MTVRDTAQTLELATQRWPSASTCTGSDAPGRVAKARAMAGRVAPTWRTGRDGRLDVALSHNSYGQLVAARLLRIPSVTAMDYEFQPANHVAFRARRASSSRGDPGRRLRRQGPPERRSVTRASRKSSTSARSRPIHRFSIGSAWRGDGTRLVAARRRPGAAYHQSEPALHRALRRSGESPISAPWCWPAIRGSATWSGLRSRVRRSGQAVDSRSLLCAADLFIGAGGTMTREAALMGMPTFAPSPAPGPRST